MAFCATSQGPTTSGLYVPFARFMWNMENLFASWEGINLMVSIALCSVSCTNTHRSFWQNTSQFRSNITCLCLISNLIHEILIYLHIIHLLKSSTWFEHYPAHLQEVYVVTVYMSFFLKGAQDSHLQRVTIRGAAYIYNYDVDLLKMSGVMLETCRGF